MSASLAAPHSRTASDFGCVFLWQQVQGAPWWQQQVDWWPSTVGFKWGHLAVFSPQSHFTCADLERRSERQCVHCEMGRPLGGMICSSRSVKKKQQPGLAQGMQAQGNQKDPSWCSSSNASDAARQDRGIARLLLTCMRAVADPVSANTGITSPLDAVDQHVDCVECVTVDERKGTVVSRTGAVVVC